MVFSPLLILFSVAVSAAIAFALGYWLKNRTAPSKLQQQERWQTVVKPRVGGAFMLLAIVLWLLGANFLEFVKLENELLAVVLASIVAFASGAYDDRFTVLPWLKLASQLVVAAIFVGFDLVLHLSPWSAVNSLATVLWVVMVMNSINMLDNMDAVAAVAAAVVFSTALVAGGAAWATALSAAGLVALLTFLPFNWNPSKTYMGDAGSQLLGALMAGVGIAAFWNNSFWAETGGLLGTVSAVAVAFVLSAADSITVSINRLRRGVSPAQGGRDHTTHHLVYAGLTDRGAAMVFVIVGALALGFIWASKSDLPQAPAIRAVFAALAIGFFYSTTQWPKAKKVFKSKHP